MPSLVVADNTFERIVQEIPAEVGMLARKLGAFSRSRAIRTPEELLRAVLLYSGSDLSLREVAANMTQNGRRLSDEAVRGRLSGCERWLQALLSAMMPRLEDHSAGSLRLKTIDTTTVQAPGAVTTDYRLHFVWDHEEGRLHHFLLTDNKIGENLKLFKWQEGDLLLADAGFSKAEQLAAVKASGAEYVVRCAPRQIGLYLPSGERLNVVKQLKEGRGRKTTISMRVLIKSKAGFETAWLHAYRLPDEKACEAKGRLIKRAQKKYHGRVNKEILYLADWVLLLTSLPPEKVSAEIIGKLYRARWQIEIVIKRLKSLLDLDALRARRGSRLARVYLLGKLLFSLIIERRTLCLEKSRNVEWRVWKLIAQQIAAVIAFPKQLDPEINNDVLKVLKERPRKRKFLWQRTAKSVKFVNLTYFNTSDFQP